MIGEACLYSYLIRYKSFGVAFTKPFVPVFNHYIYRICFAPGPYFAKIFCSEGGGGAGNLTTLKNSPGEGDVGAWN